VVLVDRVAQRPSASLALVALVAPSRAAVPRLLWSVASVVPVVPVARPVPLESVAPVVPRPSRVRPAQRPVVPVVPVARSPVWQVAPLVLSAPAARVVRP
jgi:hypothetical protein